MAAYREVISVKRDLAAHFSCDADALGLDDVTMIDYDIRNEEAFGGQDRHGITLDRAIVDNPILTFTCKSTVELATDMIYHVCKDYPNVRILPRDADHVIIKSVYESIFRKEGIKDSLAIELIGMADPNTSGLLRDFSNCPFDDKEKMFRNLEKAHYLGYTGTGQEIIQAISDGKLSKPGFFEERMLMGIFCDIAHSLSCADNTLNETVHH